MAQLCLRSTWTGLLIGIKLKASFPKTRESQKSKPPVQCHTSHETSIYFILPANELRPKYRFSFLLTSSRVKGKLFTRSKLWHLSGMVAIKAVTPQIPCTLDSEAFFKHLDQIFDQVKPQNSQIRMSGNRAIHQYLSDRQHCATKFRNYRQNKRVIFIMDSDEIVTTLPPVRCKLSSYFRK